MLVEAEDRAGVTLAVLLEPVVVVGQLGIGRERLEARALGVAAHRHAQHRPVAPEALGGVLHGAGDDLLVGGAVGDLPEGLHVRQVDLELARLLAALDRVAEQRVEAVHAGGGVEQHIVVVAGQHLEGREPLHQRVGLQHQGGIEGVAGGAVVAHVEHEQLVVLDPEGDHPGAQRGGGAVIDATRLQRLHEQAEEEPLVQVGAVDGEVEGLGPFQRLHPVLDQGVAAADHLGWQLAGDGDDRHPLLEEAGAGEVGGFDAALAAEGEQQRSQRAWVGALHERDPPGSRVGTEKVRLHRNARGTGPSLCRPRGTRRPTDHAHHRCCARVSRADLNAPAALPGRP